MKKFLLLFAAAGITMMTACGPTEEEKRKAEEDAKAAVDEMFQELENSTAEEDTNVAAADTVVADTAIHQQ